MIEAQAAKLNTFVLYSNGPAGQAALESSKAIMIDEVEKFLGREIATDERELLWRAFFHGVGHGFRTCVDAQLEAEGVRGS